MPENNDYEPAPWSATDNFADARKAYDAHVSRSYSDAVAKSVTAASLVPKKLECDSETPILIFCDVTGSMGAWPATIFSKLGYLDHEASFYFGEDSWRICFGAIGDCFSDKYPLQIGTFIKGADMKEELKKLVIEGGGGGTAQESYDLGAAYAARNIDIPKAVRPILIFIGDEGLYDCVYPDKAQLCKVDIDQRIDTAAMFAELKAKWDVYLIRKPYATGYDNEMSPADKDIHKQWAALLGEDHIAYLPEADRVVDVIFGIFAKATGKITDFRKELTDRQGKDRDGEHKIDVVLKSLMTIHKNAAHPAHKSLKKLPAASGVSVTRKTGKPGKASKSLLDD